MWTCEMSTDVDVAEPVEVGAVVAAQVGQPGRQRRVGQQAGAVELDERGGVTDPRDPCCGTVAHGRDRTPARDGADPAAGPRPGSRYVAAMARRVMCISRILGAGGREVGQLVAERLGFVHVDEEIVQQAAAKEGVAAEELADVERRSTFIDQLLESLARPAAPRATWSGPSACCRRRRRPGGTRCASSSGARSRRPPTAATS